jgi:hypothetical protein
MEHRCNPVSRSAATIVTDAAIVHELIHEFHKLLIIIFYNGHFEICRRKQPKKFRRKMFFSEFLRMRRQISGGLDFLVLFDQAKGHKYLLSDSPHVALAQASIDPCLNLTPWIPAGVYPALDAGRELQIRDE